MFKKKSNEFDVPSINIMCFFSQKGKEKQKSNELSYPNKNINGKYF